MFHGKVPQKYWVEAFFTANFLSNLLPHTALADSKSPFELLHHKPPDYRSLRVFGCAYFPMLREYAVNKLDPRSLQCVFLGYNEKYKGYRCLLPTTGRVYITRHVIFDESFFPFADKYSHLHPTTQSTLLQAWQDSFVQRPCAPPESRRSSQTVPKSVCLHKTASPVQSSVGTIASTIPPPVDPPSVHASSSVSESSCHQSGETTSCEGHSSGCTSGLDPVSIGNSFASSQVQTVSPSVQSAPPSSHPMITRSKAGVVKPNPRYALLTQKAAYPLPKTVTEALKHPGWNNAMTEEFDN